MTAKFSIGQRVKVITILDNITSKELIGMIGVINVVDPLPNGEFNYWVDNHYMHEQELELVKETVANEGRALEVLKGFGMTDEEADTFIKGVKEGLKARREGRVQPWSQVKRELGITDEGGNTNGS